MSSLSSSELDELFGLVEQFCTTAQIKNVLRDAQLAETETRDVRVSAENKDQLVTRNLRDAVARGKVSLSSVQTLVRDAEENGRQHIFLYRRKSSAQKIDPTEATAKLFSAKELKAFPQFLAKPVGEIWADFRPLVDRRGEGFIAKLYRGDERFRLVHKDETKTRITKTWELRYVRNVTVIKAHPNGVLEIRVPKADSRLEIRDDLAAAWAAIRKAIPFDSFNEWDLTFVATKMARDDDGFNGQVVTGAATFEDHSQGTAIIVPQSSDDALHGDDVRTKVVKAFDKCRLLTVNWLPTKATSAIQDELRTVIGTVARNELLVSAKTTAEAIAHVIGKLDEFEG